MSFNGKVVLITGGGSGIGAGAARHFAKLKALVSIVDLDEKRLNEVADQIAQDGSPKPFRVVANVTTDCERIINETIKHFGRLDVLVNNAGILKIDSVIEFNANDFDRVLNVNLKAPIVLTNLAVPHLEKTKGNVVNVSSVASVKPMKNFTSYCISKAGVDQFTKCAALTLASNGIRVNAVLPGVIQTDIYNALETTTMNADQFFDLMKNSSLAGRVGTVTDTNAAIAYLASESFVNGTSLVVDGGMCCVGISSMEFFVVIVVVVDDFMTEIERLSSDFVT